MVDDVQRTPSMIVFWLSVWLGSTAAGGVFGLLMGACGGFIAGCVLAGLYGIVVHAIVATVTWCFWLSPFRIVMATLAGAATAVVCAEAVSDFVPFGLLTVFAGMLGGFGSSLAGCAYWFRPRFHAEPPPTSNAEPWQFSMHEMFLHITVVSILLAVISCCVIAIQSVREIDRQATCENHLRLLAMSLQNYQASYDSLPPTAFVDDNESPVLSWRVPTMQYVYYDDDFSARLDFSKPWTDPANAPFLDSLWWLENLRCPSIERNVTTTNSTTHYVALTGPGTYWTESASIDADAHQDAILVIEWPPSDIHWAEPRDVTADKFLVWFESPDRQPRRVHRRGLHYIDARGEVRTLPWRIKPKQLRTLLTPLANKPHEN